MSRMMQPLLLIFGTLLGVHSSLHSDFRTLNKLLPGEFSNDRQYYTDVLKKLPPQSRHESMRIVLKSIKVPEFKKSKNCYMEQYLRNANEPYVQRIYSLKLDKHDKIICMKVVRLNESNYTFSSNIKAILNRTRKKRDSVHDCDVTWKKLQGNTFVGKNGDECLANMGDEKVRVRMSYVVTPTYLTSQEAWYRVSDGKKLYGLDTPYYLVRSARKKRSKRKRSKKTSENKNKIAPLEIREGFVGTWHLSDFESLAGAIYNGHAIRYTMDLDHCAGAQQTVDRKSYGGYADVFTHNIEQRTKHHYLDLSHKKIIQRRIGGVDLVREMRVWDNGTVEVQVAEIIPTLMRVIRHSHLSCALFNYMKRVGEAKFSTDPHKNVRPITTFVSLRSSLKKGRLVRMTVNLSRCDNVRHSNEIIGGELKDYDLFRDGTVIEVSFDVPKSTVRQNGKATSKYVIVRFYSNNRASISIVTTAPRTIRDYHCMIKAKNTKHAVQLFYQ